MLLASCACIGASVLVCVCYETELHNRCTYVHAEQDTKERPMCTSLQPLRCMRDVVRFRAQSSLSRNSASDLPEFAGALSLPNL